MTTTTRPGSDRSQTGYVVTTLLDLVSAVSDVAACDAETVAVVQDLMQSGRLRLLGHFTEQDFGDAS